MKWSAVPLQAWDCVLRCITWAKEKKKAEDKTAFSGKTAVTKWKAEKNSKEGWRMEVCLCAFRKWTSERCQCVAGNQVRAHLRSILFEGLRNTLHSCPTAHRKEAIFCPRSYHRVKAQGGSLTMHKSMLFIIQKLTSNVETNKSLLKYKPHCESCTFGRCGWKLLLLIFHYIKGFCSLFALKAVHNMESMQNLVNTVFSSGLTNQINYLDLAGLPPPKKKKGRDPLNLKNWNKTSAKKKKCLADK